MSNCQPTDQIVFNVTREHEKNSEPTKLIVGSELQAAKKKRGQLGKQIRSQSARFYLYLVVFNESFYSVFFQVISQYTYISHLSF